VLKDNIKETILIAQIAITFLSKATSLKHSY